MDGKKRTDFFNLVSPLIKRFLTGLVMFVIANNGYLFFENNEDSVLQLINDMEKSIITDITYVDSNSDCPNGFTYNDTTSIPGKNSGCACDWEIKLTENCITNNISNNTISCTKVDIGSTDIKCNAKCCNCFDLIESNDVETNFTQYFPSKKLCFKVDSEQSTYKYLISHFDNCYDSGNSDDRCNDYFCKKNGKCPITNSIINSNSTSLENEPIAFSSSYKTLNDYDEDGDSYILLPFFSIAVGNNFMCNSLNKGFWPSYSLVNRIICLESIRFNTIYTQSLKQLIENNDLVDYYNNGYPLWEEFMVKDKIRYQTEHVLHPETLHCIFNLKKIFITNKESNLDNDQDKMNFLSAKDYIEAFTNFNDAYYFIKNILKVLLGLQSFVIFLSVTAVSLKLFNCFYDFVKPIFFFYTYENFLSLFIDFVIMCVAGSSSQKLKHYSSVFNLLAGDNDIVDCLGEYGRAKFVNMILICDTIQGSHFNLTLIALIRFIMILLSLMHYLIITPKIKYKSGEIITILLEKENTKSKIEEEEDEEDNSDESEDEEEEEDDNEENKLN